LEQWRRILLHDNRTKLWLLSDPRPAARNIRAAVGDLGGRVFFTNKVPLEDHIQTKAVADLSLDSFIYNGHGTTADALWGGSVLLCADSNFSSVPVVTLPSETMAARVAASLLRAIGLAAHLTARTPRDYADVAIALLRDAKRAAVSRQIRQVRAASALFDVGGWVRKFERAQRLATDLNRADAKGHVVVVDMER
jgi:protein O-GlcNAc transferase